MYAETIYRGRFCLLRGLAQVSNRTLFVHLISALPRARITAGASCRPHTLMSSTHSSDDMIIEKRFTTGEHVRSLFADKCYVWQLRYLWDREKAQHEWRELSTSPLSDNNRRCTCTRGDRDGESMCVYVRYDEVEIHTPRCPGGNNASRCARQWDLRNLVSALNPPFLR